MSRWKPDARQRLEQAALELYGERGFQHVTVMEIAERAGLTERTFFRHFADKREVLFSGGRALQEHLVQALRDAPASLNPFAAVAVAIEATAPLFLERREYARRRQAIVAANPELQERERVKLASMAAMLAQALSQRQVSAPTAALAADIGVTVFRVALERWLNAENEGDLARVMREVFDELEVLTRSRTPKARRLG